MTSPKKMTRWTLVLAAAAAASGCTSFDGLNRIGITPFTEDEPQTVAAPAAYDHSLSFAGNIAREMGLVNIVDASASLGIDPASELYRSETTKNIPGGMPESWWSWDSAYVFGKAVFTPRQPELDDRILYYVQTVHYADYSVAENAFARQLGYTMKKAASMIGADPAELTVTTDKFFFSDTSIVSLRLVKPEAGCMKESSSPCSARIIFARSSAADEKITMIPAWLNDKTPQAWKFSPKYRFELVQPEGARIDPEEFRRAFERSMPKGMYLYFSPSESKGPYVAGSSAVEYFIEPISK